MRKLYKKNITLVASVACTYILYIFQLYDYFLIIKYFMIVIIINLSLILMISSRKTSEGKGILFNK